MLISEFIDRTGFRPTAECYEQHIEPNYNASSLQKDDWCKQWKRQGGIAEAYQWQVVFDTAKINEAKEQTNHNAVLYTQLQQKYEQLQRENKQLRDDKEDYRETLEDCRAKLNEQIKINNDLNETMCKEADEKVEMTVFLIQQAEKWGASDLRDKVIEIMGAREYIAYKINHDLNLWQRDKDLIVELLNQ